MAINKYLNLAGLSTVAENVNTRLKTVTSMPQDANIGAIRLYVGDDDENFKKGHIYKYVGGTQYWCYHDSDLGTLFTYTEGEPVVSGVVYISGNVATSTEDFADETYTVQSITEEGLGVEGMKGVFPRYSEGDFTTFPWEDITPMSSIQVTEFPEFPEEGKIYQYVGESTEDYVKGYFYECVIHSHSESVEIDSLDLLREAISSSDSTFTVISGDGTELTKYFNSNYGWFYEYNTNIYLVYVGEGEIYGNPENDTEVFDISDYPDMYFDKVFSEINLVYIPTSEITQYAVMPTPTAEIAGRIVQYVGANTQDLTKANFYECSITGSVIETHVPQTVEELKYDIEHYPTGTIQVTIDSDTEELDCLLNYYVYDDTIYRADNETGDILTDTALTTDEMVADEQLMYEVDAPVYGWEQKDVQPSIVAPEIVQMLFQDRPFVIEQLDNAPTEQDTGGDFMLYTYTVGRLASLYTYDTDHWISLGRWSGSGLSEALPDFTWDLYQKILLKNLRISNAGQVDYDNLNYSELTNVGAALDNILAKIYYVNPAISSFTMTPSTTEYEIGASVSNLVFAWTYNKDIITQTLTDCTLTDETDRTATAAGPYTSDKTFTLTASDDGNTVTESKSISFKHKVYWGSAADGTIDSAFILALSGKKFATNYRGTYNMTVAQDEYGYLAYPSSWGTVTEWWINGFAVSVHDCGEVSFTNASGNTTTFRVIRTTQPSFGAISPEIK